MPVKIQNVVAHFFSKVEIDAESGCWLWTGGIKPNGYGVCFVNRYATYAHRWSYELHRGAIPDGLVLDHLCKVKHCVNPDHLEAVPQGINVKRNKESTKTHCINGHPYSELNTYFYKNGRRRCKICQREAQRTRVKPVPVVEKVLKTHCANGHELTEENTYLYRGSPTCRTCRAKYRDDFQERKRLGVAKPERKTRCPHGHRYSLNKESTGRCPTCRSEYHKAYYKKRQILKPVQKEHYSRKEWEDLKVQYNNTCLSCGRSDVKLTMDHVIPLSQNGSDTIDNIQPLCLPCNIRKGTKTHDFRPQNP